LAGARCPLPASRVHAGLPHAVPTILLASHAAAEARRRPRPGSPTPRPLSSAPALRAPAASTPPLAGARCPLPASRVHAGLPRAVPATLLASRAAAEARRRDRPGSPPMVA